MTSQDNNPLTSQLSTMSGNAFLVVLGLFTLGGQGNQREIQELLGKGKSAVSNGLSALQTLELVERSEYRTWRLSVSGIGRLRRWGEVLQETAIPASQDSDLQQEAPIVVSSSEISLENTNEILPNQLGAEDISPDILEAFKKARINLTPKTKRLAKQTWVDADYIHRSANQLDRDNLGDEIGLLIWRMERRFQPGKCRCEACTRRQYQEGIDFFTNPS